MKQLQITAIIMALLITACKQATRELPILGQPDITQRQMDGKTVYDTSYPVVPAFMFTGQDGKPVSEASFKDRIYVADFIFLSCPTICPKMTASMTKVYHAFEGDDRVLFLSHTIDPVRDSVPRLKAYAESLGIDDHKWKFVTGNRDSIYQLATQGYFSTAYKDSTAPGGFVHSGGLLLVDKNRHIRGVYNGTSAEETTRLINDIGILLKEPS